MEGDIPETERMGEVARGVALRRLRQASRPMRMYLAVTNDRYEHVVHMAPTIKGLAELVGVHYTQIDIAANTKATVQKQMYRIRTIEDWEDSEDDEDEGLAE